MYLNYINIYYTINIYKIKIYLLKRSYDESLQNINEINSPSKKL